MKRFLPLALIIAALSGALLMAWYWKRSTADTARTSPSPASLPQAPMGPARLGADPAHALGDADAPVMLEEFGDFECPPCGFLHSILKSTKAEFGSRLVVVFREFPMATLHPHALAAAQAAEAAGLQGKFWEMHDLLYENQKSWHEAAEPGPIFEQYATNIGLNLDRFKRDVMTEEVSRRIRLDRERGNWIGVNSTPTVFLNGREVPVESLTSDKLTALINAESSSNMNPK